MIDINNNFNDFEKKIINARKKILELRNSTAFDPYSYALLKLSKSLLNMIERLYKDAPIAHYDQFNNGRNK